MPARAPCGRVVQGSCGSLLNPPQICVMAASIKLGAACGQPGLACLPQHCGRMRRLGGEAGCGGCAGVWHVLVQPRQPGGGDGVHAAGPGRQPRHLQWCPCASDEISCHCRSKFGMMLSPQQPLACALLISFCEIVSHASIRVVKTNSAAISCTRQELQKVHAAGQSACDANASCCT